MKEIISQSIDLYLNHPIAIVIVVLGIISALFYKRIVGWFGEHWTKKALKKLPNDQYKIINDLLISLDGITHQIDHVIISKYGIFSIETKQYNGYIVGDKYDKQWVGYAKKKKYYYTNPIRQNYGHCKALAELLNLDDAKIYNVVCIPSKARLKISDDGEVTRYYTLVDKILSYQNEIIDNPDDIYNCLIQNNITDKKIRKEFR